MHHTDMAASRLKVFFDSFSQPSRAVLLLLHVNKVPYEPHLIKVASGEARTNEELGKVNPNKMVPAINDNGFRLFDSAVIMKYLVIKYKLPNHWYPTNDVQHQAKIDEYLHWHHTFLRVGLAHRIFETLLRPRMTGQPPNEKLVEEAEKTFKKSQRILENYFLKDTKFINSDEISIADLQALCEYTQLWIMGKEPFSDKPRLSKWMEDCKQELQPHLDEVHKMIYMARDRGVFKDEQLTSKL